MPADTDMDLDALRAAAGEVSRLMKALSNPDRLLLLCQLAQGEKRVGELEELVGVLQPTLSQQLGVLRDEGLVATRRDAQTIYYRIGNPAVMRILDVLSDVYCGGTTAAAKGSGR